MSNDYFQYGNTLLPGEKARAEDVASEFQGVESAFGLLPQPRPGGDGFLVSFKVPDATDPEHVANLGQLEAIQATTVNAKDVAVQAASDANDDKVLVAQYRGDTLTFRNEAEGFRDDAQIAASAAQSAAGLPALAGNALKSLMVNAAADGVFYGTPDVSANHYTKAEINGMVGDKFSYVHGAVGSITSAEISDGPTLGAIYPGSTLDTNGGELGGTGVLTGSWRCVGEAIGSKGGIFVRIL